MERRAKNWNKPVSLILISLLSPLVLFVLLIGIGFAALSILREVQRCQIRNEIFSYVQENTQNIKLNSPDSYQKFFYIATGLQDSGVEYGYYYAPNDNHYLQGEPYRRG